VLRRRDLLYLKPHDCMNSTPCHASARNLNVSNKFVGCHVSPVQELEAEHGPDVCSVIYKSEEDESTICSSYITNARKNSLFERSACVCAVRVLV
jgi:hypothetical protein